MGSDGNHPPPVFDDDIFDPVKAATGPMVRSRGRGSSCPPQGHGKTFSNKPISKKKKAGFYLPQDLLERFTRKFHELKLAGVQIENKSVLLETALSFALDDLDKGPASMLLKSITSLGNSG